MLKCAHCETDYIPGALYCDSCGRPLPPPNQWPPRTQDLPRNPIEEPEDEELAAAMRDQEEPEQPPHLRLQLMSGFIIDLGGRERTLIGRQDSSVKLPDLDLKPYGGEEHGVSRHHAIIAYKDRRYSIEDLDSYNNTLLNGFRLFPGQQYPLRHGDWLQFGTLVVRVLI